MKNRILVILDRMIEDCEDVIQFIKPVIEPADLTKDRMRKKALSQSILNLGENTKLLEQCLDLTLTSIDWRGLKGMREIAAHLYHSLDNEIIYEVSKNHIPLILEYLRQQYSEQGGSLRLTKSP